MPPSKKPERRYATVEEAAQYLSCGVRTVRRMISEGDLAGYRVGKRMLRVDLNEIDALARRIPTGHRRPA